MQHRKKSQFDSAPKIISQFGCINIIFDSINGYLIIHTILLYIKDLESKHPDVQPGCLPPDTLPWTSNQEYGWGIHLGSSFIIDKLYNFKVFFYLSIQSIYLSN